VRPICARLVRSLACINANALAFFFSRLGQLCQEGLRRNAPSGALPRDELPYGKEYDLRRRTLSRGFMTGQFEVPRR